MNIEELKRNLAYLAAKYVVDPRALSELKVQIAKKAPPVKGIMADIQSHIVRVDSKDSDLIREIAFYYL